MKSDKFYDKSLFGEVYNSIIERFSSPLIMSFIISWMMWNHKIVLIIFSEVKLDSKLNLVDSYLKTFLDSCDSFWLIQPWVWNTYLVPLLIAILYILLHSLLSLLIDYIIARKEVVQIKIKNDAEKKAPMTQQDKKIFIDSYEERVDEYENRISELQRRVMEQEKKMKLIRTTMEKYSEEKRECGESLKLANQTIAKRDEELKKCREELSVEKSKGNKNKNKNFKSDILLRVANEQSILEGDPVPSSEIRKHFLNRLSQEEYNKIILDLVQKGSLLHSSIKNQDYYSIPLRPEENNSISELGKKILYSLNVMWDKTGQPLKESQLIEAHGKNSEEKRLLGLALDALLAKGFITKYQETGKDQFVYRLTEEGKAKAAKMIIP